MMKNYADSTINKNIEKYISRNKFLNDVKYYKNNKWSMAAWDSWAAQGNAGGCRTCKNNFYNGTVTNKRASNKFCNQVSANFCHDCINKIEEILKIKFKRF